jgi:quercetin 2,3-dioxygenase
MTATQPSTAPSTTSDTTQALPPRPATLVATAHTAIEGGGVPITRALPSREATYRLVDPWLLLDEFKLDSFGGESFPPHPHRGFEIVTYMIEGEGNHTDSEGNSGSVKSGGLQRITAGRGIWHGEGGGEGEPGPVHGLQLWINLPRALKRIDPGYQAVQADQIPEVQVGDARVRVLVGDGSPTKLELPAIYSDVKVPAGGSAALPVPEGFQGFAYVLGGEGTFGANATPARAKQLVVLGEGGTFPVTAGSDGVWFVLAAATPIREPVYFNGPFVD